MNNVSSKNLAKFTWHFIKPYKGVIFLFIIIAMLAGCWGHFNSLLIKFIVNTLSSSQAGNITTVTPLVVLLVIKFIVFDNFTWRSIEYLAYKLPLDPRVRGDDVYFVEKW